jgi:hypothetical protein
VRQLRRKKADTGQNRKKVETKVAGRETFKPGPDAHIPPNSIELQMLTLLVGIDRTALGKRSS